MADQTNPKDLLGVKKVAMNLLPAAGRIEGARAMQHGADKYGPYNWREKKVRMTIYLDAIERHLTALYDGEDNAQDSGISHLGHILAGAAILVDAKETGNLIDDRPAKGPASKMLNRYDQSKKETEINNLGLPVAGSGRSVTIRGVVRELRNKTAGEGCCTPSCEVCYIQPKD